MSEYIEILIQSEARAKLLPLLLVEMRSGTISDLARRCGLSARAVSREVDRLVALGIVRIEAVGAAHCVSANWDNPACGLLAQLATMEPWRPLPPRQRLRESLAAYGAPLVGVAAVPSVTLEQALVQGLDLARSDGTVLRVLPVVLAKNRHRIDWRELILLARKACLKLELGLLLQLTGALLGDEALSRRGESLKDGRRTRMRYFPEVSSTYEQKIAEDVSPAIARAWGFFMNMSEATFRSTLAKHCPELDLA